MHPAVRTANLTALILPFVAFVVAVVLLWNRLVGWSDLAIFAFMYFITLIGITVGFHRLFTHHAFEARAPVRIGLAALGSMAVQGPVIGWVADHRKHHAFTDDDGDPHSPHGHGTGIRGALSGLLWAHMGWLLTEDGRADQNRFAPDLVEDRGISAVNALFLPLVLLGLAIPFGLGWLITGTIAGALTALLWGGLVRLFLAHHMTWSVNSICHYFGHRRFQTADQSTNVWWLSLASMGESWHHNHHAFPRSAFHGLRRWEVDVGAVVIRVLERLGLVWNVVRIGADRQLEREHAGVPRQVRLEADEEPAAPGSPSPVEPSVPISGEPLGSSQRREPATVASPRTGD